MRLVADVGGDVRSDVRESIESSEGEVSQKSTKYHEKAAHDKQFRWPFAQRERQHPLGLHNSWHVYVCTVS